MDREGGKIVSITRSPRSGEMEVVMVVMEIKVLSWFEWWIQIVIDEYSNVFQAAGKIYLLIGGKIM